MMVANVVGQTSEGRRAAALELVTKGFVDLQKSMKYHIAVEKHPSFSF